MPNSNPLDIIPATTTLSDQELINSIVTGNAPSSSLSTNTPSTTVLPVPVGPIAITPISSGDINTFFNNLVIDLTRLYASANYNDNSVGVLENLGLNTITQLHSQLTDLKNRITAVGDLQAGFNQGYTVYKRTDFTDTSAIETDPSVVPPGIYWDSQRQCITLGLYTYEDTIISTTGTHIAQSTIDKQLGYPVFDYQNFRNVDYSVAGPDNSYWGEVVLSDEIVEIQWPNTLSKYWPAYTSGYIQLINSGAVAEWTLNYEQDTDFSEIYIEPFGDLPVNLEAIFVLKKDPQFPRTDEYYVSPGPEEGYSYYLITEYNTKRSNGYLYLQPTNSLDFPTQENVRALTLVLHQPHYKRQTFQLPTTQSNSNQLWQQMLGNSPILGLTGTIAPIATSGPPLSLVYTQTSDLLGNLAQAIGSDTQYSFTPTNTGIQTYTKYQYTYGAYTIDVTNRVYNQVDQFVSTPMQSKLNLVQGSAIIDYDLPMILADVPSASAWLGPAGAGDLTYFPATLPPSYISSASASPVSTFYVPSATITFDLTFEAGNNVWYPFAPLGSTLIHEPLVPTVDITSATLRLQAEPGTPIYFTSFDGQGGATVLGASTAPPTNGSLPTVVTFPYAILQAPGFYILSYTPIDTSMYVDFGLLAEAADSASVENGVYVGSLVGQSTGLQLPSIPFIDVNRVIPGFEPNGNADTEYVPITVAIANNPIQFPNIVDNTGHAVTISSFGQDSQHQQDLYQSVQVQLETLYTTDSNTSAAIDFAAKNGNWDVRPQHIPQLFVITPGQSATIIPQADSSGNTIWSYDASAGTIRFLNGNGAVSGQIALTYWYYTTTFASPVIVNKTDYSGNNNTVLTPFDPAIYPVIEYVQDGDKIYFNVPISPTAQVTVVYYRLFDTVRLRATFTQVDPASESATPHVYGYTLLARDGNGTSTNVWAAPEVVWGDLSVYSLGSTTQSNPKIGAIQGDANSTPGLPTETVFNWYKIINTGSANDKLMTNYDSSNGTTVFWDMDADRFIEPDAGQNEGIDYQVMNVDGSNFVPLAPGNSAIFGICNFLVAPGTPNANNEATIYSGRNADYLLDSDWLLTASIVTAQTSVAAVTID